MDKPSYEVRLAGWHDIVLAATNRPHGTLLKDWLADNNISRDQYYYWQRKVRSNVLSTHTTDIHSEMVPAVSFAEIPLPTSVNQPTLSSPVNNVSGVAIIRADGISIELSNNASGDLINSILKAVTAGA